MNILSVIIPKRSIGGQSNQEPTTWHHRDASSGNSQHWDAAAVATQNGKSPIVRQLTTLGIVVCVMFLNEASRAAPAFDQPLKLVFACRADNDLYQTVSADGKPYPRFDTPAQAIEKAPDRSGVLVLADEYPDKTTTLDSALFAGAARKHLRLYVEYPAALPQMEVANPMELPHGRGVATSDVFGTNYPRLGVTEIRGCRFVPVKADAPLIVIAKVAGYKTAEFGLPNENVYPILFAHPQGDLLVATTKLSQFVTGRYAPYEAWQAIWSEIFHRLCPDTEIPTLRWTPTVRPRFGRDETLPQDVERQAFQRGIEWFCRSRMLVHPDWQQQYEDAGKYPSVAPKPQLDWPLGDGSLGVLEGFASSIDYQGQQKARWMRRADCIAETAMAFAFAAVVNHDPQSQKIAENLLDYLCFHSPMCTGPRDDPKSPSFGMIGWLDRADFHNDGVNGFDVYFGDENARTLLGMITAAALLKSDRWNKTIARACLANLRTQGPNGYRDVILDPALQANGWQHYWSKDSQPEGQSFHLWACYLWAYKQTGYAPFLERSKTGIADWMRTYAKHRPPAGGVDARRMMLPLAWLVRIEDTPEHRQWLHEVASDWLARQHSSGAIRAACFGGPSTASNEDYGTKETEVVQHDSDPAADLLYICNFAWLQFHEAAAATGDRSYTLAEDRLAQFLCRVQIRSDQHSELDGGWFRCFDFETWEYWASGADWDWGPWCIETGWTQTWITSMLAMRQLNRSLWDVIAESRIKTEFDALIPVMMPEGSVMSDADKATSVLDRGGAVVTTAAITSIASSHNTSTGRRFDPLPSVNGMSATQNSPA